MGALDNSKALCLEQSDLVKQYGFGNRNGTVCEDLIFQADSIFLNIDNAQSSTLDSFIVYADSSLRILSSLRLT